MTIENTAKNNADNQFIFTDNRLGRPVVVRTEFAKYANGRVAVLLKIHGNQDDSYDGEPWATASVNLPGTPLPEGKTAIKGWSENVGLPELMVKAGILLAHAPQDEADVYTFSPQAQAVIAKIQAESTAAARRRP